MLNERMRQDIGTGLDAIYTIVKGRILDEMEDTNLASRLGTAAAVLGGLAKQIQDVLNKAEAEAAAEDATVNIHKTEEKTNGSKDR